MIAKKIIIDISLLRVKLPILNSVSGIPGTNYLWDFGDSTYSYIQNPIHQYLTSNHYNIILNEILPNNCSGSITKSIFIDESPNPLIYNNDSCTNSTISFDCLNDPITNQIVSYNWFINNNFVSTDKYFNYVFFEQGTFQIQLITTDTEGCKDTVLKTIFISDYNECYLPRNNIYIPNAFSPNNDGINDVFKVHYAMNNIESELQIFYRYGALIFNGHEWNGEFNGKDFATGIYSYKYIAIIGKKKLIKTGTLTFIR